MNRIFRHLATAGLMALTCFGMTMVPAHAQSRSDMREAYENGRVLPPDSAGGPRPSPTAREFQRDNPGFQRPPRVIDRQPPRPPERRVERSRDRDDWRRDRDRRDWRRDRDWDRGYYRGGGYYRDRGPAIIFESRPTYRYVEPRYVQPRYAPARGLSRAHVQWCHDRWRSYRAYDNTYQPYNGPRRQCYSPYS